MKLIQFVFRRYLRQQLEFTDLGSSIGKTSFNHAIKATLINTDRLTTNAPYFAIMLVGMIHFANARFMTTQDFARA